MTRTITAMFDSRSDADSARTRLTQSRIDADNVRIIDQSAHGSSASGSEEQGLWASIKEAFMPEEDSHAYEEGMRRGGYLLCAQVDEQQADEAVAILDESSSVDFDRRQEEWRNEGWTGFGGRTDTGAYSGAGMGATGQGARGMTGQTGSAGTETGGTVQEEHIPIVEEELKVGKREVARAGARVRSYVRETPVHEQVNLREEHVSVERRPVNEAITSRDIERDDLMGERTIEMTETAEEPVVAKEARIREELVVKKTADEHVEQIDDSVRRTEVEVDENRGDTDRSAFGFKGDDDTRRTTESSDRERETEGSGYTRRIDKSGL